MKSCVTLRFISRQIIDSIIVQSDMKLYTVTVTAVYKINYEYIIQSIKMNIREKF